MSTAPAANRAGRIAQAAELLASAHRDMKRIGDLPESCRPADMDEAEAISEAVQKIAVPDSAGWKIGMADPAVRAKLGLPRAFVGRMRRDRVHASPARLKFASMSAPKIEAEFCFTLGRDLPPRAEPYTREEVQAAVKTVHPGIEVPESRFADGIAGGPLATVADQGAAGTYVLAAPCSGWESVDLQNHPVTLTINGEEKVRGTAGGMGHPIEPLVWLANARSKAGEGLKAGEIVSTGSCTGIIPAKPGDHVVADYGPLGRVEVVFEA